MPSGLPRALRRRFNQAIAEDGDVERARAPAGPEPSPHATWSDFHVERQRELASYDRVAAIVLLCMQLVAAWNSNPESKFQPWQSFYSVGLASVLLTVIFVADSEEYLGKRRGMLAVLRLGATLSPIFRSHARFVTQDNDLHASSYWGLLHGFARSLYGDHTTLMAFLYLAFHVDGLTNFVVQMATLAIVMQENDPLCNSNYMHSLHEDGFSRLHPYLSSVQVCLIYMFLVQVFCGWLAPWVFHANLHTRRALQYAARRGIPPTDPRYKRMRFLHEKVCIRVESLAGVLLMLPLAAGVVVVLSSKSSLP